MCVLVASAVACGTGDPAAPSAKADGGAPAVPVSAEELENDVGRVTVRRLNRVEYDNTVRDLLGDTSHLSATFPPDNGAEGFTNNADALTISPLLFEKYEAAAEKLATGAVANPKIVKCSAAASAKGGCAEEILSRFAKRAWRRAVTADEVTRLVALVERAEEAGQPFLQGLELAIKATLLSPNFLFRIEIDPNPDSKVAHPLTDFELASRLSYFLWSSMPDDALFAYAEAGKLSTPNVFDAQVQRMLADPKAAALVDNFAADWLLHTLGEAAPDTTVFPAFDEDLRHAMEGETMAFLGSFIRGDESLAGMFDASFTFLNGRMAEYYGIPGVSGADFVRVPVTPESHRGGLLSHASILTMTSVATRTSPVRRGEWVLSELLCSPPPPPPPDIPALTEGTKTGTIRQRMEQHRKDPVCATCHSQMDPIGFALEHFDAIGRWRDLDEGLPIDASGQLPGGEKIDGSIDLAKAIKADPRFASCSTRKLYAYALGRSPEPFDAQRIAALSKSFVDDNYRMKNLILNVIYSDAFRMRRGGELP